MLCPLNNQPYSPEDASPSAHNPLIERRRCARHRMPGRPYPRWYRV